MAKRFVDTELYDKPWFTELPCRLKCAVQYIFGKCDHAGIWDPNYAIAAVYVGEGGFQEYELLAIDGGGQFEKLPNGKIFVVGFCDFQYGNLSEDCKPHKSVIQKLKKYGLYERVSKGYRKGIDTLQDKDKDKEKEQDKVNGGLGEDFVPVGIVPEMCKTFKIQNPDYPLDQLVDFPAVRIIAQKTSKWLGLKGDVSLPENGKSVCHRWGELVDFIRAEPHFGGYSLSQINKHFQSIAQSFSNERGPKNQQPPPGSNGKPGTSEARIKTARNW